MKFFRNIEILIVMQILDLPIKADNEKIDDSWTVPMSRKLKSDLYRLRDEHNVEILKMTRKLLRDTVDAAFAQYGKKQIP